MSTSQRPGRDAFYMSVAQLVATRADCIRRQVGAVLVCDDAIIAEGYNGTARNTTHCSVGGCKRCESDAESGVGYDTCLCVHAEENAILLSAKRGTKTEGTTLYTTLRPCFGCLKAAIQAGIVRIVYGEVFVYPDVELEEMYYNLVQESGVRIQPSEGGNL